MLRRQKLYPALTIATPPAEVPKAEGAFSPGFAEFERLAKQGNLIPVSREVLADLETPVSAFEAARWRFANSDAFLLESVEGGEALARYSFLGVSSRASLVTKGAKCGCAKMGKNSVSHWKTGATLAHCGRMDASLSLCAVAGFAALLWRRRRLSGLRSGAFLRAPAASADR
jgi:hypothetical protein